MSSVRTLLPGFWAASVPLLCAAHCLAAPLLVAAVPALNLPPALEPAFQGASLLVAAAFFWSGVRVHRRWAVLAPAAAGVALWAAAAVPVEGSVAERALLVGGSVGLAAGLWWSALLRHRTVCHTCRAGAGRVG